MNDNKNSFYSWLKQKYKLDSYSNTEYDVFNVYTKINKDFHKTLPKEFQKINIEYNFPDIIMTNENNYIVNVSKYDKNIEYFTIKIKK